MRKDLEELANLQAEKFRGVMHLENTAQETRLGAMFDAKLAAVEARIGARIDDLEREIGNITCTQHEHGEQLEAHGEQLAKMNERLARGDERFQGLTERLQNLERAKAAPTVSNSMIVSESPKHESREKIEANVMFKNYAEKGVWAAGSLAAFEVCKRLMTGGW